MICPGPFSMSCPLAHSSVARIPLFSPSPACKCFWIFTTSSESRPATPVTRRRRLHKSVGLFSPTQRPPTSTSTAFAWFLLAALYFQSLVPPGCIQPFFLLFSTSSPCVRAIHPSTWAPPSPPPAVLSHTPRPRLSVPASYRPSPERLGLLSCSSGHTAFQLSLSSLWSAS